MYHTRFYKSCQISDYQDMSMSFSHQEGEGMVVAWWLGKTADYTGYFKQKRDLSLNLTKWLLCLNLTRP